jgi:hypothetical protein
MEFGFYDKLSFQDYKAVNAANYSALKEFARSPAHYKAYLRQPEEITDARIIGSGVHMAILEPGRFSDTVQVIDGHRGKKEVKEAVEAATQAGKFVVKQDQFDQIRFMADAGISKAKAMGLFGEGYYESTLYVVDPGTDCPIKARPDYIDPARGLIVDIKTYSDASEPAFRKQLWRMRYDLQSAHYLRAAGVHFGPGISDFVSLVIEDSDPWGVNLIRTDDATLDRATEQLFKLLGDFNACLKADLWPSYADQILSSNVDIY